MSRILDDLAIQMYDEGLSLREIALVYGVGHSNVSRYLGLRGVQKRPARRERLVDHDEMIDLYKEGLGIHRIAKKVGCTPSHVHRVLTKRGIKMRNTYLDRPARVS